MDHRIHTLVLFKYKISKKCRGRKRCDRLAESMRLKFLFLLLFIEPQSVFLGRCDDDAVAIEDINNAYRRIVR